MLDLRVRLPGHAQISGTQHVIIEKQWITYMETQIVHLSILLTSAAICQPAAYSALLLGLFFFLGARFIGHTISGWEWSSHRFWEHGDIPRGLTGQRETLHDSACGSKRFRLAKPHTPCRRGPQNGNDDRGPQAEARSPAAETTSSKQHRILLRSAVGKSALALQRRGHGALNTLHFDNCALIGD